MINYAAGRGHLQICAEMFPEFLSITVGLNEDIHF